MSHLTDKQRERLLTPCECGHTINRHGSLVSCWRCEDEGGDCSTSFEALLTARIEALLAEARAEGAREALREAADLIRDCDGSEMIRRLLDLECNRTAKDVAEWAESLLRDRAERIEGEQ